MDNLQFIYFEHPLHVPYREIIRKTNLKTRYRHDLEYRPVNVNPDIALSMLEKECPLDEIKWLSKNPEDRQRQIDAYFIQEHGGVNLCNQDITLRGMQQIGIRLARNLHDFDGPTALETLTWGVGLFRKTLSNKYESTNLILADTYGELEQLHNRRHENKFLEKYLKQLNYTAKFYQFYGSEIPQMFESIDKPLALSWLKHIENGKWDEPPKSVKELLERLDYLLEKTIIPEEVKLIETSYQSAFI